MPRWALIATIVAVAVILLLLIRFDVATLFGVLFAIGWLSGKGG
jgi:hypothetical protein